MAAGIPSWSRAGRGWGADGPAWLGALDGERIRDPHPSRKDLGWLEEPKMVSRAGNSRGGCVGSRCPALRNALRPQYVGGGSNRGVSAVGAAVTRAATISYLAQAIKPAASSSTSSWVDGAEYMLRSRRRYRSTSSQAWPRCIETRWSRFSNLLSS